MGWEDRAFNKDGSDGSGPKFIFKMPTKLTFAIIIACVVVFICQSIWPSLTWSFLLKFPSRTAWTQPWRWITYQYLHGGGAHIFFNLIAIFFFVPALEKFWGWKRTLAFYTVGGIVTGFCAAMLSRALGTELEIIGASGAILAVIGAATALAPDENVIFFIFPMTMRTLALLLGVLYVLMIIGEHSLADTAHLGGLIFGFIAPFYGAPLYRRFTRQVHQRRARQRMRAEHSEQETVDRILEKVHDSGMHSLTRRERRALKKATEHQRVRDMKAGHMRAGS